VGLPAAPYSKAMSIVTFEGRLQRAIAALPGVSGVALAYDHPLEANWSQVYALSGEAASSREIELQAQLRIVSPGYFRTVGVEVVEGRTFRDEDGLPGSGVALVNEAFDRHHGGRSVGRRLRDSAPRLIWGSDAPAEFEIVGIVEDERFNGLEQPSAPAVYLSTRQFPQSGFSLLVRTSRDPGSISADLRAVLGKLEPAATISSPTTLEAILAEQLVARRLTTDVIGSFAVVALALAALGVYSLLALWVASGTREIGIRLALGASPHAIARQLVARGCSYVVSGLVLGLALAIVAGRFLETWLVGVSGRDPATLALVSAVLVGIGVLASAWPARRAARVDPAVALRSD
jgi:putative ABC transport system permease protein